METDVYHTGGDAVPKVRDGRLRTFLAADAIYLLLVFGWTVVLTPLGRDYALLARPDRIGFAAGSLLSGMMQVFGGWAPGYYLVNLGLLYGCMALIIVLTRQLSKGPWWLGSVAAVLFMANPVKTEAVLCISGIVDLLTGFLGLLVLVVYVHYRPDNSLKGRFLPLMTYGAAVLIAPNMIPLFLVLVPLEYGFFRSCPARPGHLWPILGLGAVMSLLSGQWVTGASFPPARILAPLYLVVYPIGMLPGNVALLNDWPILAFSGGVILLAAVLVLMRHVGNPVFTFGLLGAAAFRLLQGTYWVDPVTLSNGGKLILPAALFALAAAGGFQALLHTPGWRSSVVRLSTLACVCALLCQGWVNWQWLQGGRLVRQVQQAAAASAAQHPGRALALVPDLQYVGAVPVMLSQSVRYNTPMSQALPVRGIMSASVMPPPAFEVQTYSREGVEVSLSRPMMPPPAPARLFTRAWWRQRYRPPAKMVFESQPSTGSYPDVRIRWD